jgi:hypothetical protein
MTITEDDSNIYIDDYISDLRRRVRALLLKDIFSCCTR